MSLKEDFIDRCNSRAAKMKEKTTESEKNGRKIQGNELTTLATIL